MCMFRGIRFLRPFRSLAQRRRVRGKLFKTGCLGLSLSGESLVRRWGWCALACLIAARGCQTLRLRSEGVCLYVLRVFFSRVMGRATLFVSLLFFDCRGFLRASASLLLALPVVLTACRALLGDLFGPQQVQGCQPARPCQVGGEGGQLPPDGRAPARRRLRQNPPTISGETCCEPFFSFLVLCNKVMMDVEPPCFPCPAVCVCACVIRVSRFS